MLYFLMSEVLKEKMRVKRRELRNARMYGVSVRNCAQEVRQEKVLGYRKQENFSLTKRIKP